MFAPKNILVPTDFSKYANAALKKAVDIATQHDTEIYLLHVINEQIQQRAYDYFFSYEVVKQLEKEGVKASRDKLKEEDEGIIKEKKIKVIFDVKNGVPSEVILSEQKAKKIDLIVIASHGKTGFLKKPMGSVADKVVKGSKCPVIVVEP
jgi:nucleotide-binding universal stress UspA family protein